MYLNRNVKTKILPISILVLICTSIFLSFNANKNPQRLIWSDMEGYYVYLPATIIYHDFVPAAARDTSYLKTYESTNLIYTKYTCGVAILELPFFLVAHGLSRPLGYASDGHSYIYCYALMMAGLFYFWLGMYFLWKYIRKYYGQTATLIALVGIGLGTNLYYYTLFQPAMSHVFSFFLFSVFMYVTDIIFIQKSEYDLNRRKQYILWAMYGLVYGMVILVRPTSIILGLWPVYIWYKSVEDKAAFFKLHQGVVMIMILFFVLPFVPQLLYWKYISGDFIIWSYAGESFKYWNEPKLFRVLFDPWNGWILYSPIVVLPLLFLFLGRHTNKLYQRGTIYIFIIATFIFASWWAWWFGGAFGHRCYVEFLALLALPFAGFIDMVKAKKLYAGLFVLVFLVFCYYNIGLTYAYNPPWDGEQWTYQSVINEVKKLFIK